MDERLSTAARLFPQVKVGADIGANHGLLACELLATRKTEHMWLTDLSEDALQHARRNITSQSFIDRASFAVGDGFSAIPEKVEAAAILGMGGQTIAHILHSAPYDRLPECVIVSSHTEQELVRKVLYEQGYVIRQEEIVLSAGRYYILELAFQDICAEMPDEKTLFLGPCLAGSSKPIYRNYLERRLAAYRPSRSAEGIQRFQWLREEAARAATDSSRGL